MAGRKDPDAPAPTPDRAGGRLNPLDQILALQAEELERLTHGQVLAMLRAYEDGRRALRDRLASVDPRNEETIQRLRISLAQAEAGVVALRDRMNDTLTVGEQAAHRGAMRDLKALVTAAEGRFPESGGAIDNAMLARLTARQGLLLHRYSTDRYSADLIAQIQRTIGAGLVSGRTITELADDIAGIQPGSVLSRNRGRALLIARMETNRAYNEGHLEAADTLEKLDPRPEDPVLKRIDEFFDNRNHPFSRVAHGMTARLDEPFVVPVAAVEAMGQAIRKPTGGVVWTEAEGVYTGQNLPAHFNERGRITTWRASWSGDHVFQAPAAAPGGEAVQAVEPGAVASDLRGAIMEWSADRDGPAPGVAVRRWGNDLTRTVGLAPHDPDGSRLYTMGNNAEAAGYHYWGGEVFVSEGTRRALLNWAGADGEFRSAAQQRAASTLVHEILHGASPLTQGAYQGIGAVLEEVTNEYVTRATLADHLGIPWARQGGGIGSYNVEMLRVRDALAGTLGPHVVHPEVDARDVMLGASRRFKLRPAGSINTPEQALDAFVSDAMAAAGLRADAPASLHADLSAALSSLRLGAE